MSRRCILFVDNSFIKLLLDFTYHFLNNFNTKVRHEYMYEDMLIVSYYLLQTNDYFICDYNL